MAKGFSRGTGLASWIVWYAYQRGVRLTTIRIVKFLYLADLYHARLKRGQTLTGWPWAFVHYGPYCSESMNAIEEARRNDWILAESYQSKFEKDYNLYRPSKDFRLRIEQFELDLPQYVVSELKAAIHAFSDDTHALLDHVYFDTEPMEQANPYEKLNFSVAERRKAEKQIQMKKLSAEQIAKARKVLNRMAEIQKAEMEQAGRRPQPPADDKFLEKALEMMDEEEDSVLPCSGVLDLK